MNQNRVWKRFCRHKLGLVSLGVIILMVGAALIVPFFYPYAPNAIDPLSINQAPSLLHPLGTDQLGRDQLARLLDGTRVSLLVGLLATVISVTVGVVLGLLSGYFGGIVDMVIMRLTDIVMSFPYILLVLVAASIFKPGLWTMILILGFVDWPSMARLVRGNVLALRETGFVKSSKIAGMPGYKILFSDILPNTMAPVLVYSTSVVALSMLDEAALSFLGMGVQLPQASLGNMLRDAQSLTILTDQPWMWLPPGIVVMLLVVSINFVGDALRDAMDPTGK